uniref:Protein MON2 homolog n=2 Tax=Hirondellea gigas TaxID=1518452 RepID=A0A6A7FWF1_9CRUS
MAALVAADGSTAATVGSSEGAATLKLLETLQTDLRTLCLQTKKRFPHIRESSEEAIMQLRGAAAACGGSSSTSAALAPIAPHVLHPLLQAAHTKDPKIVQASLGLVQKVIVSGGVVEGGCGGHVVEALWLLMEGGVEELKVLQTVTLLVTTNTAIAGENLAKALVVCLRLHFTKDAVVANTASATVRQLVSAVMERMVAEDRQAASSHSGSDVDSKAFDVEELKTLRPTPPKTLGPAAADAFLLFQDLVQLVNADQPMWLVGLTEMTRTFGLDLLESVLTMFPQIFYKHPEFGYLLKERVCALVIQLFSPNIKYRAQHTGSGALATSAPQPHDKPYFPITMRLLRLVAALIHHYYPLLITQCEIFLSLLVKFLECGERPEWQRCLALEVLHNLATQPALLLQFTQHYDCNPHSTNIFQDIVNSLGSFVQSLFLTSGGSGGGVGLTSTIPPPTTTHTTGAGVVVSSHSPALLAGLPVGPGVSPQPAFCYRGVYLPLVTSLAPTTRPKPVFLQLVDKLEPPSIPEGYSVTLACLCLLDITRSVQRLVIERQDRLQKKSNGTSVPNSGMSTSDLDTVPVKLSSRDTAHDSNSSKTALDALDNNAVLESVDQDELGNAISEINLLDSESSPSKSDATSASGDGAAVLGSEQVEVALTDDGLPTLPNNNSTDRLHGNSKKLADGTSSESSMLNLKNNAISSSNLSKDSIDNRSLSSDVFRSKELTNSIPEDEVLKQLVNSSWHGLLAALSTLLEACTDEAATENILQAFQTLAWISGVLELSTPRDAFITALCKSCLPPHYTLTVLNSPQSSPGSSNINGDAASSAGGNGGGGVGGSSGGVSTRQQHQHIHQHYYDSEMRHQVVAVGSALATSSSPSGAQQGPVMLTNKNLQVMRSVLSLAHCHGAVLASAWHLVLTTLQHLVWILGLKPATGGSLKQSGRSTNDSNAVITTAVIADLPVLSSMLSRLFESSAQLDDVALHHLIDALCKLSSESMQLAYTNREPSLFAVAKLLETGVVNLSRVEVFWRPITNHLLEVCQHPHIRMREWGVEAVTYLVRTALTHPHLTNPAKHRGPGVLPLRTNQRLQLLLLSPLSELSSCGHADVRQKQLEALLAVLHTGGEQMQHGWPTILTVIAAVNDNHSEHLVRLAFQCLQLVVTDFLPLMPWRCLPLTVASAAKFGSQTQELNISLTAIGLMWNISDYFYQNQEKLRASLSSDGGPAFPAFPGLPNMPPFDKLWMCLYARLGDLCVDGRPAVRKSAGQTLFSTIAAHGSLLHNSTWQAVLWQVLFPLLDKVRQLSASASTDKVDEAGNILIHHSRNTHQKQWAETQVLTLSGCARVFSTKQHLLLGLPDYPRAWALMLDFIHTAALARTNEVSLAALKSLQEMLQSSRTSVILTATPSSSTAGDSDDDGSTSYTTSPAVTSNNSTPSTASTTPQSTFAKQRKFTSEDEVANWNTAWKMWHSIGVEVTKPPPDSITHGCDAYVPTQAFLSALLHTLPHLFQHIKHRLGSAELAGLSQVLLGCVRVPVSADSAAFVLPSTATSDTAMLTPLQEAVLASLQHLMQHLTNGAINNPPSNNNDDSVAVNNSSSSKQQCSRVRTDNVSNNNTHSDDSSSKSSDAAADATGPATLVPQLFTILLQFASFGYQPPTYGRVQTRPYHAKGALGGPMSEYIAPPCTAFSERCMSLTVRLYQTTAHWQHVIQAHVLDKIVQCCTPGLGLKYLCPSWKCFISALLTVLETGLPLARLYPEQHDNFWHTLHHALDAFLFSNSPAPNNQSGEEAEADEALDCRVVQLLQEQVLPHPSTTPPHFLMAAMVLLNKGSIHSAPVTEVECSKLREQFAKGCFETLLQFSLFSPSHLLPQGDFFPAHPGDNTVAAADPGEVLREGRVTSKLAVTSLLHRFKDVLVKYVQDTTIAGNCPLPRHRLAEISFVLQAIATLLASLRDAPKHKVDLMTWQQLIGLYPHLVEAGGGGGGGGGGGVGGTGSSHPYLWRPLREVLLQYAHLLQPPLSLTDHDAITAPPHPHSLTNNADDLPKIHGANNN